jgi:PAS domain S-box-containing protein
VNLNEFYQQIQAARLKAAQLYQRAGQKLVQQQELLMEGFEELNAALENLEIAQEELLQQYGELTTARELVGVERQRYEDLLEIVPNAYLVTDRKGIILEANHAAATLFNVPQRFLVGKPLACFVLKEERRVFITELNRLHQWNQRHGWEVCLQPRKGNPVAASLTVTTVHDREGRRLALGWLVCDITEHKRAAESELLLRDAVQQANELIVLTSAELDEPGPRIVFVNQAFTKTTGYSMEEITGKTPRILQGAETDRLVLNQLRHALSQGKPFQGEIINYHKDGTEYKVQMYCSPLRNDHGEITHFMSIQRPSKLEQAVA